MPIKNILLETNFLKKSSWSSGRVPMLLCMKNKRIHQFLFGIIKKNFLSDLTEKQYLKKHGWRIFVYNISENDLRLMWTEIESKE